MSQRHDHDTIERLWSGASDPNSERFVPLELRDAVAAIPLEVERKLRGQLYRTKELYRADRQGRRPSRSLNPAEDLDDLETALVWRKIEWARQQLAAASRAAEQATFDASLYTCPCCAEVVSPSSVARDRHTHRRTLADGTIVICCGKCAIVAEQLALERLAAEQIPAGGNRGDAVRKLIAEATR